MTRPTEDYEYILGTHNEDVIATVPTADKSTVEAVEIVTILSRLRDLGNATTVLASNIQSVITDVEYIIKKAGE